jgi:predicted transcriptional regulator
MPLTTLTLRLDLRLKKRLESLARRTGRSRSSFAADAIEEYISVNEWQIAGVKRAIRSLHRGEGVPHEQVKGWLRRRQRVVLRTLGKSRIGLARDAMPPNSGQAQPTGRGAEKPPSPNRR